MSQHNAPTREEMLADFQSITGIWDVETARQRLEESRWDLVEAVDRAFMAAAQELPANRVDNIPVSNNAINDPPNDGQPAAVIPSGDSASTPASNVAIPMPAIPSSSSGSQPRQAATPLPPPPRRVRTNVSGTPQNDLNASGSESSGSASEIEDFDLTEGFVEDFFVTEPEATVSASSSQLLQQRYLISDNVPDEVIGTTQFARTFVARYGLEGPNFFIGTLDAAFRQALLVTPLNRKQLALVLHHDLSVRANIFCQQVLCERAFKNITRENHIVWPWDCTHESNRQRLIASASHTLGVNGVVRIRGLAVDDYPVVIIVNRTKSGNALIAEVIPGSGDEDEVGIALIRLMTIFDDEWREERNEENTRLFREDEIRRQNEAYQTSLRIDMAKEELKRAAAIEQQRIADERLAEEARVRAEEERVRAEQVRIRESLLPEPASDTTEPVCSLRIRFPGGRVVIRRFLQSSTLQDLMDYLFTEGCALEDFKVLYSHPKKDLTDGLEENMAIGSVFAPQDNIIIEQR